MNVAGYQTTSCTQHMAIPAAAIIMPAGFFFSVTSPIATQRNALISLVYVWAIALAAGVLILGIGLLPKPHY